MPPGASALGQFRPRSREGERVEMREGGLEPHAPHENPEGFQVKKPSEVHPRGKVASGAGSLEVSEASKHPGKDGAGEVACCPTHAFAIVAPCHRAERRLQWSGLGETLCGDAC